VPRAGRLRCAALAAMFLQLPRMPKKTAVGRHLQQLGEVALAALQLQTDCHVTAGDDTGAGVRQRARGACHHMLPVPRKIH